MAFTTERELEDFAKEHGDIEGGKQRANCLGRHVESTAMEKFR